MHARPFRRPARLALILALGLAACGRPTGDFGRARPSALHDDLLPAAGAAIARRYGEPVSAFNLTDDERELRDRAWTFVRPPHAGDWWMATEVEGQRTRVSPVADPGFDPARYYDHLRSDPFRSSEARWSRVMEDITADALLVPPFCDVAARVRRADVERLAAARRVASPEPWVIEAEERVFENNEVMSWAWRAREYRLASYRIAIDRLQVETPSDRLFEANRAFAALAGAYCEGAPAAGSLPAPQPRRGRAWRGPDPFEAPVLQK